MAANISKQARLPRLRIDFGLSFTAWSEVTYGCNRVCCCMPPTPPENHAAAGYCKSTIVPKNCRTVLIGAIQLSANWADIILCEHIVIAG